MYEVIVDGQSLKDLIFVTDVDRTMGPCVKNRVITIHCYILHDVLASVDVLNKILTGDVQEFIFTDQMDRYWKGRVKEDIKVSSSFERAKVDIDIEVADGVSYAIKPRELSFSGRTSLLLENKGSEPVYPTFDFKMKADCYMVSVVGKKEIFQFGEPLEASPLKKIVVKKEGAEGFEETRRALTAFDTSVNKLKYSSYDVSKINSSWRSLGSFQERKSGMPTPRDGKVKVASWATHWQTGERIPSWVKGRTFVVDEVKNVRQSKSSKAYLLMNQGVWIGWLLEQDIDGGGGNAFACNNNNAHDLVANFASGQGYYWHGPCMSFTIPMECTNFELEHYLNYFVGGGNQYGAYFVGVVANGRVIMGTSFSTHKTNRETGVYFEGYGENLNCFMSTFASSFWGKIYMKKQGRNLEFRVFNDMSKREVVKTFVVDDERLVPTNIVIWAGRYGSSPSLNEVSAVRLKFRGLDAKVFVRAEEVSEVINVPDPRYKFDAGDVIRLEMATNKAYLNGVEELRPIAYGSKAVALKPGMNEIICETAGDLPADIDVYNRERYR